MFCTILQNNFCKYYVKLMYSFRFVFLVLGIAFCALESQFCLAGVCQIEAKYCSVITTIVHMCKDS